MVRGFLIQLLLKALLVAALGLVLFGFFSGTGLGLILVSLATLRIWSLIDEARWKPRAVAGGLKGGPRALPPAIEAWNNRSPRPKRELAAEALGAIGFAVLIPLDVALYGRDFFSLRLPQGWEGALVAAVCVGLYAWPHRWLRSPEASDIRVWWWALPFVVGWLALGHAVKTRHPYLDPFNRNHNRLMAERVLALKDVVLAGRHADWVLRYARQLDDEERGGEAIRFYREGLRLDPNRRDAYARLATLEGRLSGGQMERQLAVKEMRPASAAPYWTAKEPVVGPLRRSIDSGLESVGECTVVIVAVGEVSADVLNAAGYVVRHELGLPVYISPDRVPLPQATRVRGLVTGRQWDVAAVAQAFVDAVKLFPRAPIKYVLLTPADIYSGDATYLFSGTYEWGAVVSSARLGGQNNDVMLQRTAKQTLCALLKSFKIPVSLDRNCVTSYSRSLEEFDRKGNRPNGETLRLFRQAVDEINRQWQRVRSEVRNPKA